MARLLLYTLLVTILTSCYEFMNSRNPNRIDRMFSSSESIQLGTFQNNSEENLIEKKIQEDKGLL